MTLCLQPLRNLDTNVSDFYKPWWQSLVGGANCPFGQHLARARTCIGGARTCNTVGEVKGNTKKKSKPNTYGDGEPSFCAPYLVLHTSPSTSPTVLGEVLGVQNLAKRYLAP